MNVAFVIDTSPSMQQRTSQGASYLDCAKAAVEHAVKIRQRSGYDSSGDKYHLIVTDYEFSIRSTWEHEFLHFSKSLSNICRSTYSITLNQAIAIAFKQINMFRHATSTDTYGYGRNPNKMEPGAIIVITDNQCEKANANDWKLKESSEYSTDVWRYDQRIFVIHMQTENYQAKNTQKIQDLAESTGGSYFECFSFKHALNIIEKIVNYLNNSVFTSSLEGDDRPSIPLILIVERKTRSSFWPIPEEFTHFAHGLQPRKSNPILRYKQNQVYSNFKIPQDFPYDYYEIIRTKKFEESLAFYYPTRPAFLPIYMQGHIQPFAMLALEEGGGAKLLVLCYNFIELWECLEFYRNPLAAKSDKSRYYEEKLANYLLELPVYYHYLLPKAIRKMKLFLPGALKLPNQIGLSPEVNQKLKNLKEQETSLKNEVDQIANMLAEQHISGRAVCCQLYKHHLYCDIFKIPRENVKAAISTMATQFFGDAEKHDVPISKMGDFHTVLSNLPKHRNAYLEPESHKMIPINFGNPFKALSTGDNEKDSDDPNISIPSHTPEKSPQPKVQMIYLPVKRPRGFKAQLDQYKFLKRSGKLLLQAIAYLRQRGPSSDEKLITLLRSTISKVYKKKSTNTINAYTQDKVIFLDAISTHAKEYKKTHLIAYIEGLKTSLLSANQQ
ncbi:INTS6 [Blepharisma stoltei]|uniref:VWFA domain-containing protein n=1 Tax=Blepharisma stoltei TaxID=1481888 RepID=A0AAU9K6D2_9CILI|nr:unnamed protein product [Blepharisma stoltei]